MKPTGVMEGKWKNVCRKSDRTICVLLAQKSNSNLFDPCLPPRVLKMGCTVWKRLDEANRSYGRKMEKCV